MRKGIYLIFFLLFLSGQSIADSNIDEINDLLKITPKDHELYFQRGYLYYQHDEFDKAGADFTASITLAPDEILYRFYKAKTDLKSGKNRTAIEGFKTVIEMNPVYAEAYFFLGILHHRVNEREEALMAFDKAIELNNTVSKYWAARARFEKECGNIDSAVADYEKVLGLDPDFAVAHFELAWIDFEKQNLDAALEHAQKTVILEQNPLYFHTLACIYSEKNIKKAIENEITALSLENNREYERRLAGFKQGVSYTQQVAQEEKIQNEKVRNTELEKLRKEKIWEKIVDKNKSVYNEKSPEFRSHYSE